MPSRISCQLQRKHPSQWIIWRNQTMDVFLNTFKRSNRTSITNIKWFKPFTSSITSRNSVSARTKSESSGKDSKESGMKSTSNTKSLLTFELSTLLDWRAKRRNTRNSWLKSRLISRNSTNCIYSWMNEKEKVLLDKMNK